MKHEARIAVVAAVVAFALHLVEILGAACRGMVKTFGVVTKKWKPVVLQMQLTSAGGLMGKTSEPVESAVHPVSKTVFIKMNKSQRWLQRIVSGSVGARSLDATNMLETLTSKIDRGKIVNPSDHDDGPEKPDALMAALDYEGEKPAVVTAEKVKTNSIVKVNMPEVCPTASVRGDGPKREVTLWFRGKRSLWLSQEDAEWAICWLRVELDTLGVHPVEDSSCAVEGDSTTSSSPGPEVRWSFADSAWSVVRSDQEGVCLFRPEDLRLQDTVLDETAFQALTYSDRKRLTLEKARASALQQP